MYEGTPSSDARANAPQSLQTGMNLFLSNLDITFRRDPTNYRPRINKYASTKDREQKEAGTYYYMVRGGQGGGGGQGGRWAGRPGGMGGGGQKVYLYWGGVWRLAGMCAPSSGAGVFPGNVWSGWPAGWLGVWGACRRPRLDHRTSEDRATPQLVSLPPRHSGPIAAAAAAAAAGRVERGAVAQLDKV